MATALLTSSLRPTLGRTQRQEKPRRTSLVVRASSEEGPSTSQPSGVFFYGGKAYLEDEASWAASFASVCATNTHLCD